MAKLTLEITGAEPVARELAETGRRLRQPLRDLLEVLGAMMVTFFQTHIRDAEGPSGAWPELAPQTKAIRAYYGHPAAGPRLIRAGDLLQSLQLLELGEDSVTSGTRNPAAETLQNGGSVTDDHGKTRQVQAFPFVFLTEQETNDLVETIEIDLFGGGRP